MEISTIEVQPRNAKGRNQVARLRDEGLVPAVLYGAGKGTMNLTVLEREFERHVRQHHKVFKLRMDGKEQAIFLQDVQWDCLTDKPVHIDFMRIDLTKPLHVQVEAVFLGHPVGISHGSRLVKDVTDLKIECLPDRIPENVEIQVGHLDLGDHILAGDVELPEGVKIDMPADTVICHVPGEEQLAAEAGAAEGAETPAEPAPAGGTPPEGGSGDS